MADKMKQYKPTRQILSDVLERGEAKIIAGKLQISQQYVTSWCREISLSRGLTGRRNPLDNLQAIVDVVAENDGCFGRCYPLAQYVAVMCGGYFVPMQSVEVSDADLMACTAEILIEVGQALDETRVAWFEQTPEYLTQVERKKCLAEIDEAVVALLKLRKWAER